MISITSKNDLLNSLIDSNVKVNGWFTVIPTAKFFTRYGETWSPSDNLDHLIRSHKPIAKALKLPKFTLRGMFGKPDQPSRGYEEVCRQYRAKLAAGAVAIGPFVPDQKNPKNNEEEKTKLLILFSTASAELASTAEKWTEEELDGYLLPHPLIGKLTIREMLFFTIYHNLRHSSLEGD